MYVLTNLGLKSVEKPSISGRTNACPSTSSPAPTPTTGIETALLTAAPTCCGTASKTIAIHPS